MRKAPTVKDVAARAGVSVMAVSRVCNPGVNGRVSAAMRSRVLVAIEELGYHPDILARALKQRRTDTIGFFDGYRGMLRIDNDFARSIFIGLQDTCAEMSQDLLIFNVPDTARGHGQSFDDFGLGKVDGVIFLPQAGDEELARNIYASHRNVIAIGEACPGLPAITAQDAEGSRHIAQYLSDLGHRHVLYRRSSADLISARRRFEAFSEAAENLRMRVTTTTSVAGNDELDETEQEIVRNCKNNGITALVAWHDYSAVTALKASRNFGLRVPEDIAIVGFDGLRPSICPMETDLTTIAVDWSDVSRRAVEFVVRGRDAAIRHVGSDQVIDVGDTFEVHVSSRLHIGNTT